MQTHKVVNPSNTQYDNGTDSVSNFANGKVAMIINQNNANATLEANGMTADQFGVVPYPTPAASTTPVANHVAGINIAAFANTDNRDGASGIDDFLYDARSAGKF